MPHYNNKLRNKLGQWYEVEQLTSSAIRNLLFEPKTLPKPKIVELDNDVGAAYFYKLNKLTSIPNKSKMLRLLYGDVYTAERLKHFGMSETDRCRRCFEKETITHLLTDCPYSLDVYSKLGLRDLTIEGIIGTSLSQQSLEIRSEIIIGLVFRLQTMPPEVLIKSTLDKFAKGLARKHKVKQQAEVMLRFI
jgi:hypothetical protein